MSIIQVESDFIFNNRNEGILLSTEMNGGKYETINRKNLTQKGEWKGGSKSL